MADIIRTVSRTERRATRIGADTDPTITTQVHTVVRSITGDRIDVSVIRDFVKALDSAGAPANIKVEGQRTSVGHLSGLTAEWTTEGAELLDQRG